MKKIIDFNTVIILLAFVFLSSSGYAQEIKPSHLTERMQQHLEKHPIEKVHLHLDKPYYLNGDDIWFKAYVRDDRNETPSLTSGILYIDLVGPNETPIKTLKLALLNGVAWGDFKLPENISGGKYTLFAYTQWMRNQGTHFFFKKELLVKSKNETAKKSPVIVKDIDLQFLPEGGSFVTGLPCKLAFKAINSEGFGEYIDGAIYDNDGIEIVKFESAYLGMGQLAITPTAGKEYTAKIKLKDNTERNIPLPKAAPSGYVINVNTSDPQKLIARVYTSADLLAKEPPSIIVHHNGKVYFESKVSTDKQISVIPFPTTNLPSGVVEITLLNSKNIPLCERAVFINNNNKNIDLNITGLKQSYSERSALSFDIHALAKKTPSQGSFSIAVTNTSLVAVDEENETHILSSLLLKSDLVGFIEKPNDYFTNNDLVNRERVDYLMLTQGWRKIPFAEIINKSTNTQQFEAENDIKISGLVTKGEKILPLTKVSILSTPSITFSKDTVTDENGRFAFRNLRFPEGTKFVLKVSASNTHKVKILLDTIESFSPQVSLYYENKNKDSINANTLTKYFEIKRSDTSNKLVNTSAYPNLLKTVKITGKANKAPNSLNLNGPGNAAFVFDSND